MLSQIGALLKDHLGFFGTFLDRSEEQSLYDLPLTSIMKSKWVGRVLSTFSTAMSYAALYFRKPP